MSDNQDPDENDDDLGRIPLGLRILVVISFAWLLLSYQLVNPGIREQFPWSDYFVIGPAPVLIALALFGIWSTLRRN